MTALRRIAVSNLAWPRDETPAALRLLARLGVGGVEIAPAQAGLSWDATLPAAAEELRTQVEAEGLRVAALQGWLFGVPGATLFGAPEARTALAEHLRGVAELAGRLGAAACVWGAPRSRDPGTLREAEATEHAVSFLRTIAADFAAHDTVLAFEANATRYGCRFVTRTEQALALAAAVDRPGVGAQFDTGTVFINGETLDLSPADRARIAHVHVSEADLVPVGSTGAPHASTAAALRAIGWDGWVSVEMKEAPDWQDAIARAVTLLAETYP